MKPGDTFGSYHVVAQLGAGGMGEVYRARDAKLKRDVAIKVLPETFAHDPERVGRLRREAEVLASLNHSHIAAIYDLVEIGALPFLVLELVEGETLADRIGRGAVPWREATGIATQIAAALEAAHDRGIIHRDLKPANVKITTDGQVKVLDFGLAKVHAGAAAGLQVSDASTLLVTTPGLILGTVAYMSPEQANGAEASRTSDMWAFGCVLYEMLAGRRAFEGATTSEILANVLKTEPDSRRLPADTPDNIRRLLRRCLQKDPRLRLRDMRDARLELDDVEAARREDVPTVHVASGRKERLAWASALGVVALIAGFLGVRVFRPAPVAPEIRLDITTPWTRSASIAVSPDGSKVVFVGTSDGQSKLWLRSIDSSEARPLAGTERGLAPFWSPNGRSIGFFADGRLKRVDIAGGSPQTLAPGGVPLGGAWNSDGTILFGNNPGGAILRTSAAGGDFTPATRIGSAEQRGHAFPSFLPDGRHFLFFAIGSPSTRGAYIGQLDDLNTTRLFGSDGPAVYFPTGHLLFVRDQKVWAHAFDPVRRELQGEPFAVVENVGGGTTLSASAGGTIAFRTAPADSGQRQLVWVDRSGRQADKVVYPDTAAIGPSFSPDGRRIAVYKESNGNMDLWSYERAREAWERITFDPGDDIFPLWSPDGASITFGAVRGPQGVVDLYRKLLAGGPQGSEELLVATSDGKFPMDWSRSGRFILYDAVHPKNGSDIWALPLDKDRKPFPIVQTEFAEGQAQFSADEHWIAYQSNKTGRNEIYIRPFPGPGGEVRASIAGGSQPRWNPKGQELFFIGADDRLMAVPIDMPAGSGTVEAGVPRALFATTIGSTVVLAYRQQYLVSADGQSFVLNSYVTEGSASPITVILNWKPKPR
jgi:eukaryotic-like serine/threonine-protein kinase